MFLINYTYSKVHNFKTNKDFSFKFGLNVIYILQNVLITLNLAITHQAHIILDVIFAIFEIFEKKSTLFF